MTMEEIPNPNLENKEGETVDSRPKEEPALDIDALLEKVDRILDANAKETDDEKYLKGGESEKRNPKKD